MTTKILDIQEFNTSMGILRFETHIAEENNFRSVVENKIIYNGEEFPNIKALEDKLDCYEYDMLRSEVYDLNAVLEPCKQALPRSL